MIKFPGDFKFGFSTVGTQHEMGTPGSEFTSDWYLWLHDPENIASGLVSGDLPEHGPGYWDLYKQDHSIARDLGLDAAWITIEWARIFPKPTFDVKVKVDEDGKGNITGVEVDEKAIEELRGLANLAALNHYREILSDWKARGGFLIINLFHWAMPTWLHDPIAVRKHGPDRAPSGWLDRRAVIEFAKFAAFIAHELGDLADMWYTMNEPGVVITEGYLYVKSGFPPGYLDLNSMSIAAKHLIEAHARAYDAIKAYSKKPIGLVYSFADYQPLTPNDEPAVEEARALDYSFLDAPVRGELMGVVRDDLKGRLDWIGVNYYTRAVLRRRQDAGRVAVSVVGGFGYSCEPGGVSGDKRPCSDFGWEIYPEGMYNVLMRLHERYRMPMYVTENGIADEHDRWRSWFLVSHLYQVHRAMQAGADVRGYFHWNLTDNLEWAAGYRMRFGLVYVDYSTKRRYLRPSALVMREIARQKAIPDYLEHYTNPPKLG
ncbi:MAG: beta-galactosidase [Caldivirga sp. MG_3]|jgi:Beta-glucosidase/6-phospho-beta-glucosidase/beta-galactosidase|nr:MAG: beta-galactosidase [Caldivirga sp. MG_3]